MKKRAHGEGHRSRDANGLYRFEISVAGRRIVRKAKTKGELERKIRELKDQIARTGEIHGDGSTLTFGQLFDSWLAVDVKPTASPRTIESYESVRRIHLSRIERVRARALKPMHLQQIANAISEQGKARMAGYVIDVAQRALNFGIRQGWLTSNVTTAVKRPAQQRVRTRSMTEEESAALLDELKARHDAGRFRYYPLVLFLLNTGVRISEALGLRWTDVDRPRCRIEWQVYKRRGAWQFRPAKQGSRRTIELNDEALHALDLAWNQIAREREAAAEAYQDLLLVFPREDGEPLHRTVVASKLRAVQEHLGFDRIYTVHELRHTFLSHLARIAPLQVVQRVAGHSSTRTTERYVHALEDDVRHAMRTVQLKGRGRRKGSA